MNLIQYLCLLLSEECNEVGQRASKLARFGHDEIQPGQNFTNFERLRLEKTDLMVVYDLLVSACGNQDRHISIDGIEQVAKQRKILKFTKLSVKQGQISEAVYQELKALTFFVHHLEPIK